MIGGIVKKSSSPTAVQAATAAAKRAANVVRASSSDAKSVRALGVHVVSTPNSNHASNVRVRPTWNQMLNNNRNNVLSQATILTPSGASLIKNNTNTRRLLVTEETRRYLSNMTTSKAATITEEQVRQLFAVWNDALATGNPDTVAKLYTTNKPILLPTISDVPRTDYDSIVDYFKSFLPIKPQGKIIDSLSQITIGEKWALDAGVYEFTMGATGNKVMARYSFIYVLDDDQVWRILHHHSSVMPESIVTTAQPITKQQVQDLFHVWNDALATLKPENVANLYTTKNPVLLPTVSDVTRTTYAGLLDYFEAFLKLKPQGVITESNVYVGTNWAQDAGLYEFTLGGANDKKVKARYSFIYVYEEGKWRIQHHHSSAMPEGIPPSPQPITELEVGQLFQKWNAALATLDADQVARCYAKNAVLLPTLSNTPRTNYDLIKDYFEMFLQRKPQGKIKSNNIILGYNWAQDAGIYEFTMGDDGSVVPVRYSFLYVYEDGDWKISNHHSSFMPEQ